MKASFFMTVFLFVFLAVPSCSDRTPQGETDRDPQWRELDIPPFKDTKDITDTKVYRLRKDHELVFVLSQGKYLDRENPRSSYIGHIDGDNNITLTNLKDITERNTRSQSLTGFFIQDIADPHVHVTSYDLNHVWVSWACGMDTHVCAIRSEDGGKSFNDETFSVVIATGLFHSVHEPSMICNSESDCLLTWGETLIFTTFDLYVRRFTKNGWCTGDKGNRIGLRLGIPVEMSAAIGDRLYFISAVDCAVQDFQSLRFEPTILSSGSLDFHQGDCHARIGNIGVIDTDFECESFAAGSFHYKGAAGNISPRIGIPAMPTWQIYSYGCELKAIRRNSNGEIDVSTRFCDPDPQISIMAGNVDFDGARFFVFYHRFYGVDHPQRPNTYSICYRTTTDAHSLDWSEEICPVENLQGLTSDEAMFMNMIQPVGSAWQGNIGVIFQKECSEDACSLAIKRFENRLF